MPRRRAASTDKWCLVRPVVVHDDVHVEVGGHAGVETVEELAELDRSMAATSLADHRARLDVQRCKQRRGAVSPIVVGASFGLAGLHRQQPRRAVKGLNLGLLVDAEHHGMAGRIDIQANDVPDLFDQQRVRRQLEGLAPMGTQPESAPMQLMVMRLSPVGRASDRVLQCVAPGGVVSKVATTTCSTCSSVTVRGARGRGSSISPSSRSRTKRARHLPTVAGVRRKRRATVLLLFPAAQARTMRARRANCGAVRDRRANDSRCFVRPQSEQWQPLGVPFACSPPRRARRHGRTTCSTFLRDRTLVVCPRNDLAVARTSPNGSSNGDSGPNRRNASQIKCQLVQGTHH